MRNTAFSQSKKNRLGLLFGSGCSGFPIFPSRGTVLARRRSVGVFISFLFFSNYFVAEMSLRTFGIRPPKGCRFFMQGDVLRAGRAIAGGSYPPSSIDQ